MTREEYNQNPNYCCYCQKPILCLENQKLSNIKRKKFCDSHCAAIYNNSIRNNLKKKYYCQKCGALIGEGREFYRRKYCDRCSPNFVDWSQKTYGELKSLRGYQVNSRIRELARDKYLKTHSILKCEICGYDKHIEIHHIKGISTFSDDTLISEINNETNLMGLCPNHHWEIENNALG